ncbi:helix-turn-helix domain-containing protein [Halomonas sp. ATCH28]|uniref:Helix-turn-helix domain-containing protein n=1 Tax=Halomonas gemina TaxID=2945105 RepID=A0ABT0SXZ4_9GAMM|nr:helix-turn-helix domain-containing protein [Halomonas gemina]MCL7939156.1 helix-turn-helix domain-containing protein [Halomonas gemina]
MSTAMKKPREQAGASSKINAGTVDPSTQSGRLLQALRRQPLSSYEITLRLHIAHPASPIRDLRKRGHDIRTEHHPHPTRPNERIKRYRLIETE